MEVAYLQNKKGKYYSVNQITQEVELDDKENPLMGIPKEVPVRKEDESNYRTYNDFKQKRFRFLRDGALILRNLYLLGIGIESDCTLRIEGDNFTVGNLDFTTMVVEGTGNVEINCIIY